MEINPRINEHSQSQHDSCYYFITFHSSVMHACSDSTFSYSDINITTLSEHVVTRMRRLDSQNGGQKHLESVEA